MPDNEALQTEEIPDVPERPENLEGDVLEYVEWLEARIKAKDKELEQDGSIVRGVAFVDLFGVRDNKQVKVGISANSRVSPKHALMDIVDAVGFAKGVRLTPYIPDFNIRREREPVQPPDDLQSEEPAKKSPAKKQTAKKPPSSKKPHEERDENGLPYEGRGDTELIDFIKIIPQPDDRATVEFWRQRRKYAEFLIINWTHQDLLETFPEGDFELEDFSRAQQVDVKYKVTWVYGAVTQRGTSRYKDVTSIDPV
jgi:hypothetical protein